MKTTIEVGGNWSRMLRKPVLNPGYGIQNTSRAGPDTPPTNTNYLLMLAAAIATLLAVACSQLPEKWGIKCTVEPMPVESPAPHDAPTTGTWTIAESYLEA